jgi:hypothetical protein|tara:strand:- start:77 stop:685 length:609 start_codon:yes stop_codon:yes gene_type:complete
MPRQSVKVYIDPKLLKDSLSSGGNGASVARLMSASAQDHIKTKQDDLVKNLMEHPVSKEISDGSTASNISGTLGGYGNLFSFLGFDNGSDPVAVIEGILSKKLRHKVKPRGRGSFLITVFIPEAKEIFADTPMPWASGLSWAEGVEKGVSNAAAYLFNPKGFPDSKSGTGLQSQNKVSGVSFKRTPYITNLIQQFKKDLLKS